MIRSLVPVLLVYCAVVAAHPLSAGEKGLPADLAMVPPDAQVFVHLRAGDVWRSDFFKDFRDTLLKAGKKALTALDERFYPAPSSLDRITVIIPAPAGAEERGPVEPVFVLTASKPIDKENFLKYTVPDTREEKLPGGKILLVDMKSKADIYFADERTLAFGPLGAVRKILTRPRPAKGLMMGALKDAQAGKALVVAVNTQVVPPNALQQIPPQLQPLLKAKVAVASLDLRQQAKIDMRLMYENADDVQDAHAAVQSGMQLARKFLVQGRAEVEKKIYGDGKPGSLEEMAQAIAGVYGLGAINRLEEYLATEPLQKEGNDLRLAVEIPQSSAQTAVVAVPILVALLVPAVQKVREAAARTQSSNNLKMIGLAMHNYHDVNRKLPSAAICDAAGKPLLSWRVAILPFVEQQPLYRQFKLDEPWDSDHNRKLIAQMPPIYAVPAKMAPPGETHYRVFVGGGAGFEWSKGLTLVEITDGTSNTILAVEAADSVPWTKPDELVFGAKKPLPRMGDFYGRGQFMAVFFDGSVRALNGGMAPRNFQALITRAADDPVQFDD